MLPTDQGAFRLFQIFGIRVMVHWSWFLIAFYQFQRGKGGYVNSLWMVWEILGLFGIVLLHEFGHALACRSVGGQAERIILWPFGGIAFVRPPHRPAPFLWSIAAGPLVNVVLIPVFMLIRYLAENQGIVVPGSDAANFLETLEFINRILLIFNILPIYPLDGGQILQSILWFFTGYSLSVAIAGGIGLVAGGGIVLYGFLTGNYWLGFIALFIVSQAWKGLRDALELRKLEKEQRREIPIIDI